MDWGRLPYPGDNVLARWAEVLGSLHYPLQACQVSDPAGSGLEADRGWSGGWGGGGDGGGGGVGRRVEDTRIPTSIPIFATGDLPPPLPDQAAEERRTRYMVLACQHFPVWHVFGAMHIL